MIRSIKGEGGRVEGRPASGRSGWFAIFLLWLVLLAGCNPMWLGVAERERVFALESARVQTQRGQCAEGLESLDRAEAKVDIGLYAREAIIARTRCYEKLGLREWARAHRQLLTDFYTTEPMALPSADGSSVFRVGSVPTGEFVSAPDWLVIGVPRYSRYARRVGIIGRVVLSFDLDGNARAERIRVLEMPHPLLATWAIEAIAQAEPKKGVTPRVMPGTRYVASFEFEWRWAD